MNLEHANILRCFCSIAAYVGLPGAAIEQKQREIFACARSIASLRGGRKHGKLGLVMTPSAYELIAPETPYIRPVHPGDPPTYDGMNQRENHANE